MNSCILTARAGFKSYSQLQLHSLIKTQLQISYAVIVIHYNPGCQYMLVKHEWKDRLVTSLITFTMNNDRSK